MDYKIIRSSRKTVAIHIKPDLSIEVRAPLRMPRRSIEQFVLQKQEWIKHTTHKITIQRENTPKIILTKELLENLRETALQKIPPRVEYYSKIMGVSPASVRINSAKTRWGSCSAKNNLNFSCLLMLADDDMIDYVVIHELAHITQHNHSPKFWKIVSDIMPNYKEIRKKLAGLQIQYMEEVD